jgi:heptosyltransferase-2
MKNIAVKLMENDLLLIPHRSARSTLIAMLSGVSPRIGFDASSLSILHSMRIHRNDNDHEISKNLSLLSHFMDYKEEPVIKLKSEFRFDAGDIAFVQDLIADNNFHANKLIAIFPGSVWQTKRWIPSHFSNLVKLLDVEGYKIVLLGSRSESELCELITSGNSSINLAGKMSISQSLIFLEKCRLVITNDSAPTHFAGLMGTPVLTIYGPTSPIFGFYPIGEGSTYIELQDLKCRPCEIHGSNKCPINTHECMERIEASNVFTSALFLLNKT